TRETRVSSPTDLSILVSSNPGVPLRATPIRFALRVDADTQEKHHATIDCRSYRVIFGDIHAPEFIYHGSLSGKSMQIISALQARTLLSHGCEGFLATIHDTTSDVPSIHDQPIVSEFPDVFPDELPGIPPFHEIRADLSYVEEPEAILDRQDRVMRKKTIPFVKIFWRNHPEREATWETEESIRSSYPHFLP
nr:hypothetical protein [Tanacetum cinerariifolium]